MKFVNISGNRINLNSIRLYKMREGTDHSTVDLYFAYTPNPPLSFSFAGPFKEGAKALLKYLDDMSVDAGGPYEFSYRIVPERNQVKFKELQERLSSYRPSSGPFKELRIDELIGEIDGLYERWVNQ